MLYLLHSSNLTETETQKMNAIRTTCLQHTTQLANSFTMPLWSSVKPISGTDRRSYELEGNIATRAGLSG